MAHPAPFRGSPSSRTLRALLAFGALLALTAGVNAAVWATEAEPTTTSIDDPELVASGETLYGVHCVMCHGAEGRGGENGPSLIGQGAAGVDFVIRTGRMPLDNVGDIPKRRMQQLTDGEREAIVAYVVSLTTPEERGLGLPPPVDIREASLARGLELYTNNCAACHGPTAAGVAVGRRDVSSTLDVAEPYEIALAIRSGPGVMPVFGEEAFDHEDLEAIVAWVVDLRDREAPGGASIGRSGPVSEGMIVWIVGIGGLLGISWFLGDKKGKDGHDLQDADGNPLTPEQAARIGDPSAPDPRRPGPSGDQEPA